MEFLPLAERRLSFPGPGLLPMNMLFCKNTLGVSPMQGDGHGKIETPLLS